MQSRDDDVDALLKEARESWENAVECVVPQLREIGQGDSNARGFFHDYSICRTYVDLRIVGVWRQGTGNVRRYWVPVIERIGPMKEGGPLTPMRDHEHQIQSGYDRLPVFINDVELADRPEGVLFGRTP